MNIRRKQDETPEERWQVVDGEEDLGRMSEKSVKRILYQTTGDAAIKVRQGNGPWFTASEIVFFFQQLDNHGYFIDHETGVLGPFVGRKVIELFERGVVSESTDLVKRGKSGDWHGFAELNRDELLQHRIGPSHLSKSPSKDSGGEVENSSSSEASSQSLRKSKLETSVLENDSILHTGLSSNESKLTYHLSDPARLLSDADTNPRNPGRQVESAKRSAKGKRKSTSGRNESRRDRSTAESTASTLRSHEKHDGRVKETAGSATKSGRVKTGGRVGLICLDCGRKINVETGNCEFCSDDGKSPTEIEADRSVSSSRSDAIYILGFHLSELGKLSALGLALVVAGIFLAQGTVATVFWRSMHTSSEQWFGILELLLAGLLMAVAWFAVHAEFKGDGHQRIIKAGGTLAFVAAITSYFISTEDLRASEAELQKQMRIWTEMMENGGYEVMPDIDSPDPAEIGEAVGNVIERRYADELKNDSTTGRN